MAAALQALGLLLGLVSWCLQSSCSSSRTWRVRSQADTVASSQWLFEGLWESCAASALGSVQCSRFRTLLGLPVHVQFCRALMILSLLVGMVSIVLCVLGMRCTKLGRTTELLKGRMTLAAGSLFILSGLSTLVAVSWYAGTVIQEFNDPFRAGVRFELGAALYQGWAASCLSLLGGSLLCCSYRANQVHARQQNVSYKFSTSGPGLRIYRAPGSGSGSGPSTEYV